MEGPISNILKELRLKFPPALPHSNNLYAKPQICIYLVDKEMQNKVQI